MLLICSTLIKLGSELKVYLSWSPPLNSEGKCTSSSDSLYSYDCDVLEEITGTKRNTYQRSLLREIQPNEEINLQGMIKNGKFGTYSLIATVYYKGFTYIQTTSN